ncbi:MAG: bifunctional precorrin-2 dehydrogenase/sirohydrochlorin ferrochelatase [Elusimicrobia bacterium]|nr:bifunctional precorrin-2 dehydrogenase/sirohydrochlorin ferrochelatase [Elusimicrobiota bacterium]
MGFYPAFLNLSGKECLVVGGGRLALHKTEDLLEAGAQVTVVSPRLAPGFRRLKKVRLLQRVFRAGDLISGPWLVIAATDDESLHARIARLCRARRIWVNVVDRPRLCDFIVPSVVRRGPVTFAVSTGGLSPAVAKYLGADLRGRYGVEVGRLAAVLKGLRAELLRVPIRARRKLLEGLVTKTWVDRFRSDARGATAAFRAVAQEKMKKEERNRAKTSSAPI